jgi:hypothetical protein
MRHQSHQGVGSTAAQTALAALAGWTPSRRGFLSSLLVASAATAAAGTAAAIIVPVAADIPAGSSRMAHLISEFIRLNAALYDLDYDADVAAWDRAAEARAPALEALVFERPSSLIDFAAKMSALVVHPANRLRLSCFRAVEGSCLSAWEHGHDASVAGPDG